MAQRIPVRINNVLTKPKSKGTALTFECSVTSSSLWTRDVIARQSTSALVEHQDSLTRISKQVGPDKPWIIPEYAQDHFILLEAPHYFSLDLSDRSLYNSITIDVKRMYCFAGKYDGRLTIRSDVDQTVKLSYA